MDDLQYMEVLNGQGVNSDSFKPCYKWMTFNTWIWCKGFKYGYGVLNLVINGWPSILIVGFLSPFVSFEVLNLVINGWPSIPNANQISQINNRLSF